MTESNLLASRQTEESEASFPSSTPTPIIYTPPSEDACQNDSLTSKPHPRSPQASPYSSKVPLKSSLSLPLAPPRTASQENSDRGAFGSELDSEDEEEDSMVERPAMHRPSDGRSQVPLLKDERGRPSYDGEANIRPGVITRRSTFRSKSPDFAGASATKKKYTYAAFFLGLSLISFVIQTETAVYIQHDLKWKKAYCML